MYDQRPPEPEAAAPDSARRRFWHPEDVPPDEVEGLSEADRYVAVDRIDGPVATLAVAPWPTVEPETGRLDFGPRDERRSLTVSLRSLQTRVDGDRSASGQLVRVVRSGDVFLVRGFGPSPSRWGAVVDVTRSGRLAAKAALYSTAAPAPTSDELPAYGLDRKLAADRSPAAAAADEDKDDEPPPPGPVAYPAV